MTSNHTGDTPAPTTGTGAAPPPQARGGADPASRSDRAQSFEHGAQLYALVRPEYPPEAVEWLLPAGAGPGTHVLDLAAGTGKLTRSLLARGLQVTAVEPSPAMRAELEQALSQAASVTVLPGTAESIPLETGSVDAVVVGQAWHWFSPASAAAEIARVLRPGGRLGIVWNVRDNTTDWVSAFTEIIHRGDTLTASYQPPTLGAAGPDDLTLPDGADFGPLEHTTVRWHDTLTPADLRALAASRSYLLTLDATSRDALLDAVEQLTRTHPDLRGKDLIDLPYDAQCWRADRLPAPAPQGPGRG